MSGGGGSQNTVTTQSGPPAQYLQAYTDVLGQAKNVAATPNQQYTGQTVAGFSPDQSAGITATENAYGMAAPYINTAAQYINNSTKPVSPGYLTQQQIEQYQSPYTQDVINATQAQFNNQNAIQQNQIAGNAGTAGAFGGDRQGVAQAVLAGQQQLAQAPVIAGLRNQGYASGLQAAQGQQQMQLGANEANAWLNSQAGYGMANLGNAAQTSALTGANALLGVGGLEQQQGQALLNVPYQQYLAQQAYPFQTTGWLANIAEGLGGASGGTGSTTTPGASIGSQIAGAGLAGAGILGQTGAFGANGWLTGGGGGAGVYGANGLTSGALSDIAAQSAASAAALPAASAGDALLSSGIYHRGGMIPHRAPGGALVSDQPLSGSGMPVSSAAPYGMSLPGMDVSVVPGSDAGQMGNITPHTGMRPNLLNTSTGSTTTTTTKGGDSTFGSLLKTAGAIAAGIYGGPAGALAANALGSQVHFARGGGMRPVNDNWSGGWSEPKRAAGGATQVTIVPGSYAGSPGVPQVSMAPLDLAPMGNGVPPTAAGSLGNAALSSNPTVQSYLASTLGGASFHPTPVYTPPTPAAPAAPTSDQALKQAITDFFGPAAFSGPSVYTGMPQSQGTGASGGAVSKLAVGGRADGGGNDASDDSPWDVADEAPTGMGPPSPSPPAEVSDIPWDMSQPARANTTAPARPTSGDPWKALTDVGLGIMGGSSPNALTNVGRGALQGLKEYSAQKNADTLAQFRQMSEENAAKRLADMADATLAKLKQGDAKLGIEQQRADTGAHAVEVRQDIAARAAELKAQGMSDAQANAQAKLDIARGRLGVSQQRADTADRGVDVQQQRADTANTALDVRQKIADRAAELRQQGLDQNQANRQAQLEIARGNAATNADYKAKRSQQIDQAQALREKALQSSQEYRQQELAVRQATGDANVASNVMNNATRAVAADLSGKLTLQEAVRQQLANRPGKTVAASPAAPAAPQIAPMPKSAADAVPGTIYNTARGPAKWDGTQFVPVSP